MATRKRTRGEAYIGLAHVEAALDTVRQMLEDIQLVVGELRREETPGARLSVSAKPRRIEWAGAKGPGAPCVKGPGKPCVKGPGKPCVVEGPGKPCEGEGPGKPCVGEGPGKPCLLGPRKPRPGTAKPRRRTRKPRKAR